MNYILWISVPAIEGLDKVFGVDDVVEDAAGEAAVKQRVHHADHHWDGKADHERGDGVDLVDGRVLRELFEDVDALRVDAARVDENGERQVGAARRQPPQRHAEASGARVQSAGKHS